MLTQGFGGPIAAVRYAEIASATGVALATTGSLLPIAEPLFFCPGGVLPPWAFRGGFHEIAADCRAT